MPAVAPIFPPIAAVLAAIEAILSTVADVLEMIARAYLMAAVDPILDPVAPAVPELFMVGVLRPVILLLLRLLFLDRKRVNHRLLARRVGRHRPLGE